jgi:nicotinamidase-related amidase
MSDVQPALLVIDLQQGLFKKSIPIYNADLLLEHITSLIDRAHRSGAPVFYVQHANTGFLAEGTEGWQFHPDLHPTPNDTIIHKRHGSAFQETPLGTELAARNIHHLIITGLVTHGCVKATCLDALKQGYHVTLVRDGHSNYHAQAGPIIEEWNQKLAEAGADLKAAQEIAFMGN